MDDLDALAMQAAAVDGEVANTAPGAVLEQQEQAAVLGMAEENSQGVAMILGMAVPLLSRMYPSLAGVYTPEEQAAIAASLGPLLAKYKVSLKDWGSTYKEEIGALFVCGPIAWATVQGIKADIAARAQPNAKPADQLGERKTAGRVPVPGDVDYREPAAP
jgi:hypothetical protein